MRKDGIISCHDRCKTHMQAMVAWQEYTKNKASGASIADRLDAARSQLIAKNWHYLKTILQVCSQQEIAFRGHNESVKSPNRGNFLERLKLIASHDEIVIDLCVDPGMLYIHPQSSRMKYCILWVKWFRVFWFIFSFGQ